VFKSTSQDYIPPAFQLIDAARVGSTAAFSVDVTDLMPTGPGTTGPGTVKRVLVAVRSGTAHDWTFTDLAQSTSDPKHWTGGAPVTGTQFEYFVQAVDAAGNVAVSTNKGFYFSGAILPPPTGGIDGSLSGPQNGDWFTGSAALNITKPAGVEVEVSVDGGPFGPAPSSITGDGVHRIDIRGSNGGTDSLIAPIDTTPPEIVIGAPANGGTYVLNARVPADYTCRDSGSGVVTPCTGTVPNGANIDTSSVGTKTFTVQGVTDAAGRSTGPRTVTYTVGLRKIVFSSGRTGDGDIYTTNPDGTGLARLTTASKIDEQPALSPDGTKIAFASRRDDFNGKGLEIYVMDVDGQNVVRLTNAKDDDTAPAWSPDGRKIAFQTKRDGSPEIYVMNADGTGQTRLTNSTKQDIEPTWSPNGQRIAFMSDRMGGPNIWVMDSNGANVKQLTFTKQPEGDPAWSPDGSLIAFGSKRSDLGGSAFDIFTMKPDGTNITRLTTAKGDDFEPAWSRDGLKIVFTSQRDGNPEIYAMNANGSGQARVTTSGGFDRQPDW